MSQTGQDHHCRCRCCRRYRLCSRKDATPFKLGTFEQNGRAFVGVVLKDAFVMDLAQASAALKTPASKVASPTDMKDLIARYDTGVRARIGEILANTKQLEGGRASGVRPRTEVAENAAADHVSDDDAERRGELPGARGRDGRRSDRRPAVLRRAMRCRARRARLESGSASRTTSDGTRTCSSSRRRS